MTHGPWQDLWTLGSHVFRQSLDFERTISPLFLVWLSFHLVSHIVHDTSCSFVCFPIPMLLHPHPPKCHSGDQSLPEGPFHHNLISEFLPRPPQYTLTPLSHKIRHPCWSRFWDSVLTRKTYTGNQRNWIGEPERSSVIKRYCHFQKQFTKLLWVNRQHQSHWFQGQTNPSGPNMDQQDDTDNCRKGKARVPTVPTLRFNRPVGPILIDLKRGDNFLSKVITLTLRESSYFACGPSLK